MRVQFAHLVLATLVAVSCVMPAWAYQDAGASDGSVVDNPGMDITRAATPAVIEASEYPVPPQSATSDDSANPLWAIPLSAMTATRDRPAFRPSRRPPAPVVTNEPAIAPPAPQAPAPPERPNLVLIGTVVNKNKVAENEGGENKGIAVFTDQSVSKTILLRTGDQHNGWVLQSVAHRAATLKKRDQSEILQLQRPTISRVPAATALNMPQILQFRHH